MTSLREFPQFASLPLEVRQIIWFHALPGPRVLQIKRNASRPPTSISKKIFSVFSRRRLRMWPDYVISAASYGGHQPAILSVNRESREEALCYLTPLFGIYWNLDIDMPYFEMPTGYKSREEDRLIIQTMRAAGELDSFRCIAIDWMFWERHR